MELSHLAQVCGAGADSVDEGMHDQKQNILQQLIYLNVVQTADKTIVTSIAMRPGLRPGIPLSYAILHQLYSLYYQGKGKSTTHPLPAILEKALSTSHGTNSLMVGSSGSVVIHTGAGHHPQTIPCTVFPTTITIPLHTIPSGGALHSHSHKSKGLADSRFIIVRHLSLYTILTMLYDELQMFGLFNNESTSHQMPTTTTTKETTVSIKTVYLEFCKRAKYQFDLDEQAFLSLMVAVPQASLPSAEELFERQKSLDYPATSSTQDTSMLSAPLRQLLFPSPSEQQPSQRSTRSTKTLPTASSLTYDIESYLHHDTLFTDLHAFFQSQITREDNHENNHDGDDDQSDGQSNLEFPGLPDAILSSRRRSVINQYIKLTQVFSRRIPVSYMSTAYLLLEDIVSHLHTTRICIVDILPIINAQHMSNTSSTFHHDDQQPSASLTPGKYHKPSDLALIFYLSLTSIPESDVNMQAKYTYSPSHYLASLPDTDHRPQQPVKISHMNMDQRIDMLTCWLYNYASSSEQQWGRLHLAAVSYALTASFYQHQYIQRLSSILSITGQQSLAMESILSYVQKNIYMYHLYMAFLQSILKTHHGSTAVTAEQLHDYSIDLVQKITHINQTLASNDLIRLYSSLGRFPFRRGPGGTTQKTTENPSEDKLLRSLHLKPISTANSMGILPLTSAADSSSPLIVSTMLIQQEHRRVISQAIQPLYTYLDKLNQTTSLLAMLMSLSDADLLHTLDTMPVSTYQVPSNTTKSSKAGPSTSRSRKKATNNHVLRDDTEDIPQTTGPPTSRTSRSTVNTRAKGRIKAPTTRTTQFNKPKLNTMNNPEP